jgi:hypothetical protein
MLNTKLKPGMLQSKILLFVIFSQLSSLAFALLPSTCMAETGVTRLYSTPIFSGVGLWILISVIFTLTINWIMQRREKKQD